MNRSASVLLPVLCFVLADALIDVGIEDDAMTYYYFNEGHKMAVCSCAKCGTTSLGMYLYRAIMRRPWNFTGTPLVQNMLSPRWGHQFRAIPMLTDWPDWVHHKIAVVRDPKERLLSAWKSKLACVASVNKTDRAHFLPELYDLAGRSPVPECITFKTFVNILKIVKDNGELWKLNRHFVPQQFWCFRTNPVNTWTIAAPISDPRIHKAIDRATGFSAGGEMEHRHASTTPAWVEITPWTQALLDEITADEYAALKGSLLADDSAHVHGSASRSCANEACGVPCSRRDGACVTW